MKTVRALKKRHGNRDLAVSRRYQPKKWTQDNSESRKKLAAAWDTVTRDQTGTMLQEEPLKDRRSRRDVGRNGKALME
jgi:hypothetical protein